MAAHPPSGNPAEVRPAGDREAGQRWDGWARAESVSSTLVRPVAVVTVSVTALLTVLSALVVLRGGRGELFAVLSVGGEANVPSWWSATLLLACGVVCAAVAALGTGATRPSRGLWWLTAAGFTALSLDETSSLHERLGHLAYWARDSFGVPMPTYAWLGPGLVVVAVLGVFFLRWLLQVPRDVRLVVGTGAALVLTGALGFEAAAGLAWRAGETGLMYAFTAAEELLEMSGMVVALLGLLRLLRVVAVPTDSGTRKVLALRDDLR